MSEEIEKVALNNIKWIQIIARFEWAKRGVSVWQRERKRDRVREKKNQQTRTARQIKLLKQKQKQWALYLW